MLAPEECSPITIAVENETQVDLLNRQDFVNQIVGVAESLAASNKNVCYAINGEWGVGKTFILDAFEKRLRVLGEEGSILSKYNLFTLISAQGSRMFSSTTKVLTGLAVLSERYKEAENGMAYITHDENGRRTYVDVRDPWGLLLGSYRIILGYHGDTWHGRFLKIASARKTDIQEYVLEYWRFIKILN